MTWSDFLEFSLNLPLVKWRFEGENMKSEWPAFYWQFGWGKTTDERQIAEHAKRFRSSTKVFFYCQKAKLSAANPYTKPLHISNSFCERTWKKVFALHERPISHHVQFTNIYWTCEFVCVNFFEWERNETKTSRNRGKKCARIQNKLPLIWEWLFLNAIQKKLIKNCIVYDSDKWMNIHENKTHKTVSV